MGAGGAPTVCAYPRCPNREPCPQHGQHARQRRDARRQRPSVYDDPRWRAKASAYRKLHPTCERCGLTRARQVHHLDGLGPNGPRGYDDDNLEALCVSCHSRETAANHGGFGNTRA